MSAHPPLPAEPERERQHAPSARTRRGLDGLNFVLADVQTGVGPFLAIFLADQTWNERDVGLALTVAGLAGIVTQTPAGDLVDRLHAKRALIAGGILALALASLAIAWFPAFWPVMLSQVLIGGTSSVFIPAVCAISLGVVGPRQFDERQGRNQTFNSAGNVVAAVAMGLIAYYFSNRAIFYFVVFMAVPTCAMLLAIRPEEIDYDTARGATSDASHGPPTRLRALLRDRPLMTFLACAVLFHFANAAMLPLLGQMLAKGQGRASMMFMAACVVTTQLTITALATWSGRAAGTWGRKPLLLIAFAALPLRGVLYTLTANSTALIAIQVLDGIGAGIFNVVSVLVIADLTRGTGRFNLTLGAITTAVGIGASLSQVIAGGLVVALGYHAGFLFLAAIATLGLALLWFFMPETRREPA